MIEIKFDAANSILYVRPKAALEEGDFVQLARTVDPYIEKNGNLAGLIIEVSSFPGWENLGAMVSHIRFVRDHHRLVRKIGLVTDSAVADIAKRMASHFVAAEIRHFPSGDLARAESWITDRS